MEEFDDVKREPDAAGVLNLSHGSWSALDSDVFDWCARRDVSRLERSHFSDCLRGLVGL